MYNKKSNKYIVHVVSKIYKNAKKTNTNTQKSNKNVQRTCKLRM